MKQLRFPNWAEVLLQSQVQERQKRSWQITLRWYLSFCRRGRVAVTVESARDFIAWAQEEKQPQEWQLTGWKEALNWFFREAIKAASPDQGGLPATPIQNPPAGTDQESPPGPLASQARHKMDASTPQTEASPPRPSGHPEEKSVCGAATPDTAPALGALAWKRAFLTVVRRRHYSYRTEQSYLVWLERFARFCGLEDLQQRGSEGIKAILDQMAGMALWVGLPGRRSRKRRFPSSSSVTLCSSGGLRLAEPRSEKGRVARFRSGRSGPGCSLFPWRSLPWLNCRLRACGWNGGVLKVGRAAAHRAAVRGKEEPSKGVHRWSGIPSLRMGGAAAEESRERLHAAFPRCGVGGQPWSFLRIPAG